MRARSRGSKCARRTQPRRKKKYEQAWEQNDSAQTYLDPQPLLHKRRPNEPANEKGPFSIFKSNLHNSQELSRNKGKNLGERKRYEIHMQRFAGHTRNYETSWTLPGEQKI